MTVLSVAYPLLPVSAASGGGAEQVLCVLERGIVQAGHRSLVIAAKGSEIAGELIETPAIEDEISDTDQAAAQEAHLSALEKALHQNSVDIVHFHGLDFERYLPASDVPKLATLHLPPSWYPESIFSDPRLQLNCVSQSEAASVPAQLKLPIVVNGIDINRFPYCREKEEYLLWLGRICPEKGVHIALQVAHELDLELRIAGPVHPFRDHMNYFASQIAPLLDGKRVHVGPADLKAKVELLARARCLLIPSLVAETSSLVAMEALASGTPVIAYGSGALPEVIDHRATGFLVDSPQEMAAAVKRSREISPWVCRNTAVRRFDSRRMIRDYLSLYERISACA